MSATTRPVRVCVMLSRWPQSRIFGRVATFAAPFSARKKRQCTAGAFECKALSRLGVFMRRYEIREPKGIAAIQCVDCDPPRPGPGQILIDMKAWSLNYRDL